MMTMKLGKRLHRIAISLDDDTFLTLSHLAAYERRDLAGYVGQLIEQQVHGLKLKLPDDGMASNASRCDRESQ